MTLPEKSKYDEYTRLGLIRSQTEGGLTIYQYTELTQFDRLWNGVTLTARGIVFDDKGRIIQRCLPKFFNSDEPDGVILSKILEPTQLPVVQDKLDGSLIKVCMDSEHGLIVTSKASFSSKQANWAKEILASMEFNLTEGYTYHFELIHPSNQIVLNYGDKKALVLLAIVENSTGKELDIYKSNLASSFEKVEKLPDDILQDVNKLNEHGLKEGVIANFGSYRLKYKTDKYVRLHRIVTNFTPRRVWECLSSNHKIDRQNIPEEFINWLDKTESDLKRRYHDILSEALEKHNATIKMTDKEIGLSDIKDKHYIFALRNGRDVAPLIWKAIKPKESNEDTN